MTAQFIEGNCIRHKKPYPNEPEKMILEIRKDHYLVLDIYPGGEVGVKSQLSFASAHVLFQLQR